MGYVKVKKGGGYSDIVSADNVGSVKKTGASTPVGISIVYLTDAGTATKQLQAVISGGTGVDYNDDDVQSIVDAIGKIGGGVGSIMASLSAPVASVTVSET